MVKTVEGYVEEATAGWKNKPKIKVVDGLPKELSRLKKIQDIELDSFSKIKGIFDSKTEIVYIVAPNVLNKSDAVKVILHESVGHYGLRAILGAKYASTMQSIYANADPQIKDAIRVRMKNDGITQNGAVEEMIAEAVESGFVGRKPAGGTQGFLQALKNFLEDAIRKITKVLNNSGIPMFKIKTGEKTLFERRLGLEDAVAPSFFRDVTVADLVAKSADFVFTGRTKRAEGKPPSKAERIMFSNANSTYDDVLFDGFLNRNISNSTGPKPGLLETITSNLFRLEFYTDGVKRQFLKFKVAAMYKGSSVEQKLKKEYNNLIRDSLGNIRPDIFMVMAEHADTLATAVMKLGKLTFNKDVGWQATEGKDSLFGVVQKIADFGLKIGDAKKGQRIVNDVLVAIRADDLRGKDIIPDELLPSKEAVADAKKILARHEEIKEIFEEFTRYKNGLIDAMVQAGRISKSKADDWKAAAGYIPWNRIKDIETSKFNDPKSFIKELQTKDLRKLKGSKDAEIDDVINNMVGLSFWMVNSTVRNHAAVTITDAFVKNKLGVDKISKGDYDKKSNVDKDRVVTIYRNGEQEFYEYEDVLDVYAFKGLEVASGPIINVLTSASNFLRKAVTATPQFAISQLIQDSGRAMLLSGTDNPFRVASGVLNPLSYASVRLNTDPTVDQLRSYGIVGSYDLMQGRAQEEIQEEFGLKQKSNTSKFISFFENFSIASDAQLRKAVFQQTLAETKSERFPDGDVLLARYKAQEIINFKRQGANKYVGILRQTVPFLNAYIQGMGVYFRAMSGTGISNLEKAKAQRQFLANGFKIATLASIYTFLVSGDEEYEGQNEYIKDKNFIIPGTGRKLPVAPEIGFLFKVIPERTINYIIKEGTNNPEDAQTFRRNISRAFIDAFSGPGLAPQGLKTPVEMAMNYSLFRDAPIVPRGLENVALREQFTTSTSELAKMIGAYSPVPLSPIQVEYFIRGMGGIAGGMFVDATNVISSKVMGRRDYNFYEYPIVKTFSYDKIPSGQKSEYYEFRDEIDRVTDTVNILINRMEPEKLIEYLEKNNNLKLYALGQSVRAVQNALSTTRSAKKIIDNDKDLSPEEKRDKRNNLDMLDNDLISIINIPWIKKNILER